MKHLDNLTIHCFRGLRDLHLQDLGQINILVGGNNSGKTSVLEAISTYCCPLDLAEWLNTAWRREIKYFRTSQLDALKWLFPQNIQLKPFDLYKGETYISGNGKFPVIESRATYQEVEAISNFNLEENPEELLGISLIQFDNTVRGAAVELKALTDYLHLQSEPPKELSESFEIWSNQKLTSRRARSSIILPIDTITPVSHRIEKLEFSLLSEAILKGFKPEVIELLQIVDEGIIDLQILSPSGVGSSIYINHQRLGFSPLNVFGDGVRRLLFIALTLAKVRGGFLLIDELETAIHTEALNRSFSWLVQSCKLMNVQLFATTHSLEGIDAILDASDAETDLVLYRLEKWESQTKAVRIERDRLQRLREDLGMEVRA